jgi:hypothetical protein
MNQINSVDPAIIDEALVRQAAFQQIEPDVSEIVADEGVELHKVIALRLDYKSKLLPAMLIVDLVNSLIKAPHQQTSSRLTTC